MRLVQDLRAAAQCYRLRTVYISFANRAGGKARCTRCSYILRISNRYVPHMRTREFTSRCLHLSSLRRLSDYPAMKHECRSPDRPHNASGTRPARCIREYYIRERGRRRSCGTTDAVIPVHLMGSQLSARVKNEL